MFSQIVDTIWSVFGKGKLCFKVTLNTGQVINAKLSYVGDLESITMAEKKQGCLDKMQDYLRQGEHVVAVDYTGRINL